MKKKIFILPLSIISSLFIVSCNINSRNVQNSYLGENAQIVISDNQTEKTFLQYCDYIFFESSGIDYSLHASPDTQTIDREQCISHIEGKADSFDSINVNDELFVVTSFVGLPLGSATSGLQSLCFKADADFIVIYFYESNSNLYVSKIIR